MPKHLVISVHLPPKQSKRRFFRRYKTCLGYIIDALFKDSGCKLGLGVQYFAPNRAGRTIRSYIHMVVLGVMVYKRPCAYVSFCVHV